MPNPSTSLRHACIALARQPPRCTTHMSGSVPHSGYGAGSALSTSFGAVFGNTLGGGCGAATRGILGWSSSAPSQSKPGGGLSAAADTGYRLGLRIGPSALSTAAAGGTVGKGSASSSSSICIRGRSHSPALMAVRYITGLSNVEPAVLRKARVLSSGVGGLAGAIGSLVGVGGGVIISPIIGAACKSLPQRVVSGTSLAAVIATGTASGYVYWSNGCVDLTSAAVIGASALLTAPAGAAATHKFDCAKLRWFLGWWLYLVAVIVPVKAVLEAYRQVEPLEQQQRPQPPGSTTQGKHTEQPTYNAGVGSAGHAEANGGPPSLSKDSALDNDSARGLPGFRALRASDAALAAVGGVSGFASGLLGIGGGTVVTPLLAVLSGMPQAAVVGTSLAGMALPACAGLFKHARLNNVDWLMAAGLSFGSMAGSYGCSSLALHAPPHTMEVAFSVGMAVLGNRTLVGLRKKA